MKNNKLIAEFMGIESDNAKMRGHLYECPVTAEYVSTLEYQTSWDWLIPVMKKIDSYVNEEMSFAEFDDYRNKYRFIADISIHNDISDVYNQVVEFIKSYNKEKIK